MSCKLLPNTPAPRSPTCYSTDIQSDEWVCSPLVLPHRNALAFVSRSAYHGASLAVTALQKDGGTGTVPAVWAVIREMTEKCASMGFPAVSGPLRKFSSVCCAAMPLEDITGCRRVCLPVHSPSLQLDHPMKCLQNMWGHCLLYDNTADHRCCLVIWWGIMWSTAWSIVEIPGLGLHKFAALETGTNCFCVKHRPDMACVSRWKTDW